MSMEAPGWAQEGVEVVHLRSDFGGRKNGYGKIAKIVRRLGNGNIRIDGHNGQWRPSADGYAYLAGTSGWSRASCRLVTDELRAEIAIDREYEAALRRLENERRRLEHLIRSGDKPTVIAAASTLTAIADALEETK